MGIADLGPKSNLILNADIIVKAYEAPQAKDHLSILSYNIGFGVGPVQVTVGETKPRSEFLHNLDEIARVVEETSADILLLQEVDLKFEYVSSTVVDIISSSDHLPVHVVPKLRD